MPAPLADREPTANRRLAMQRPAQPRETQGFTELAARIRELALARWGGHRDTALVGLHASIIEAQGRLLRCAQADGPVLITGETGTGKELFARALYLLGRRNRAAYTCVNCAQYQDGQLLASELFGHRRGSFTGAVADQRGVFEAADGGVVFLDEIGELSVGAQAMLLRALSEGEVMRVGETHARKVDVRVVAATSRSLPRMIAEGRFRADLYYRLRFFHVHVPPLRERGADVDLLAEHVMRQLCAATSERKLLSPDGLRLLRLHHWPGNVRELRGVVEAAFHGSPGPLVDAESIAAELRLAAEDRAAVRAEAEEPPPYARQEPPRAVREPAPFPPALPGVGRAGAAPAAGPPELELYRAMTVGAQSFWDVVYAPFMARDLSRREARAVIELGLRETRGSYKRLLTLFRVDADDYLKFMDFLRHHRLKPDQDEPPRERAAGKDAAGERATSQLA
jgi:transcriptional regulator with GAF, ATPase, and Fis domain